MSRPSPSLRQSFPVFETVPLRWDDNDIYGHLNNTVHYRLVDTAVNQWLIRQGLLDLQRSTHINMVVETGCRFHAEAGFPDQVSAGLRIRAIGSSSIRWEIGLFRGAQDQAFADLTFTNVRTDKASRRPEAIPPEQRVILQLLLADPG